MKKRNNVYAELQNLATDAQALIAATSDVAGEKVADVRRRLGVALERGRETWENAREKAVESARAADEVIREKPYHAMAVAFGVGAILGILLARRDR